MSIVSSSKRLVRQTAQASYKDPAAWVAFIGFLLGGLQSLLGAAGNGLFTARQMGMITLVLGVAGLIVRGIETFFLRREENAAEDAAEEAVEPQAARLRTKAAAVIKDNAFFITIYLLCSWFSDFQGVSENKENDGHFANTSRM